MAHPCIIMYFYKSLIFKLKVEMETQCINETVYIYKRLKLLNYELKKFILHKPKYFKA